MKTSLWRRLARLGLCVFAAWVFFWVLTPLIVAHCPPLARYGKLCDDNDITPGALYYSDVPVTVDAEQNNRDTVRYLPHGGRPLHGQ